MDIQTKKELDLKLKKIIDSNKRNKNLIDLIIDFTINKINKKEVKPSEQKPKRRKKTICTDENGNFVKCKTVENDKVITEDGINFTGTIKQIGVNGEKTDIMYKEGHKRRKDIGANTVKVYTEKSTKIIKKDIGTVAEIKINESLINEKWQSFLYYDPEVKLARIEFDSKNGTNLAEVEIRYDGIISGISKKGENWQPYFIKNGLDVKYDIKNISNLYGKLKRIMKECKDNSLFTEKNPVNEIEKQIDGLYYTLVDKY